ncbi:MAG TPA: hypothetical protein VF398_02790 [bacterium]|jgi:hypothetical protein
MSFEDDPYRYWDPQDEYEAELIKKAIEEVSVERAREYLGTYGDAIERRVAQSMGEAEQLLAHGHPGAALILAFTACELIVRFYILKPLVHGAFLSDGWANVLVGRILNSRTSVDRDLLPKVLQVWGIDLNALLLPKGRRLWAHLIDPVCTARNDVVHRGSSASTQVARDAIDCAKGLMEQLVQPLARRFGLSWPDSRAWAIIEKGVGGARFSLSFSAKDPFSVAPGP